jgi:shikimate dehydrogenase
VSARLAVLGSPIEHSRSPLLHAAAAEVLGLDWRYGRVEVTEATLPAFLEGLGPEWVGLSLTMPLKRAVLPLVLRHEPLVDRLGLANTVRLGADPHLANTDVGGIEAVLRDEPPARTALVLGAGATAASALVALRRLGAERLVVAARRPEAAGEQLGGLADRFVGLSEAVIADADLVVSTLPGHVEFDVPLPASVADAPLLDVAYSPWPTSLGARWLAAGGRLLHGLDMLIEQAVLQVRVFTDSDPEVPMPDEPAIRAAMRAAVGR